MPLYLVRHAHAVDEEENRKRPLSERGRTQVRALAAFFNNNQLFTPAHVWHSPLLRARETAELLLNGLASDAALVETPDLLPEDDPVLIANRIQAINTAINIALVGHQPHLGALVTLLLRGKPARELVDVQKAAVISLGQTGEIHKKTGRALWRINWHITPDLLTARPAPAAQPWPP
ncbi:MAG: histidine phosphatase family protein [Nibricoccus sp.]